MSWEALRAAAIERRDAGAPAEAAALLTEGLARWPEDLELRLLRAQAFLRAGALEPAKQDYLGVLERAPGNAAAELGLGDLALAAGDDDEAQAHYERALSAAPGLPDALAGLGWLRLAAGDLAGARADFQGALTGQPGHPGATEGMRLLGDPSGVSLLAYAGGQTSAAAGAGSAISLVTVLSADGRLFDTASAGVTWRRLAALTGRSTSSAQQELHGRLAWDFGRLRANLYGARLFAPELATLPNGFAPASSVHSAGMLGGGLTLRGPFTYAGHLLWTAHDDDVRVLQAQLGASHLLTSWLRAGLDLRTQYDGTEAYPSVGLELAAGSARTFVAVGGRYGDEGRPVELTTASIYSLDALRAYTANVRLSTALGDPVQLTLSWDGEGYATTTPSGNETTSLVHRVGAALFVTF